MKHLDKISCKKADSNFAGMTVHCNLFSEFGTFNKIPLWVAFMGPSGSRSLQRNARIDNQCWTNFGQWQHSCFGTHLAPQVGPALFENA